MSEFGREVWKFGVLLMKPRSLTAIYFRHNDTSKSWTDRRRLGVKCVSPRMLNNEAFLEGQSHPRKMRWSIKTHRENVSPFTTRDIDVSKPFWARDIQREGAIDEIREKKKTKVAILRFKRKLIGCYRVEWFVLGSNTWEKCLSQGWWANSEGKCGNSAFCWWNRDP